MTRDEQRINKELKKNLPKEIRKLIKKYNFKYAHDFLYRFEGDFLYIGMPSISSDDFGVLFNYVEIKPWVLDEIYWKTQKMDLDLMLSQPKSFHVRGAFTIGNIYFSSNFLCRNITIDNLNEKVEQMLIEFDKFINVNKNILKNINSLIDNIEGYTISSLNKALVYINQGEYEKALFILKNDYTDDSVIHMDLNFKTSREYVIEYCLEAINKFKL